MHCEKMVYWNLFRERSFEVINDSHDTFSKCDIKMLEKAYQVVELVIQKHETKD